jgi:glutamyl-tRNA synthetase
MILPRVQKRLAQREDALPTDAYSLSDIVALYKSRSDTLEDIAAAAEMFYLKHTPNTALINEQINDANRPMLLDFIAQLKTVEWQKEAINALIKSTLAAHGLKMPMLGVPLRALLFGQTQSPSLDAVFMILGRDVVLQRLSAA